MKKNRKRQRRISNQVKASSAICLPPPRPPLIQPRKEPEALRAFRLPKVPEPLASITSRMQSRQAHRQESQDQSRNPHGKSTTKTKLMQ